jgi:carbon-monoxide dehydrogenase medium subunit
MLAEFEILSPASLDEALELVASDATGNVRPLGGGTNLVVDLRAGRESPTSLVSLCDVAELRYIKIDDGRVSLGAGTTVSDVLRHRDLCTLAPALAEAATVFAGMMVRNTATLAGNLCCGSPAADLMPPLLVLGAELRLASKTGQRVLPLDEFYLGFKNNQLQGDELITEISFPIPPKGSTNAFYKLARRKGDAITVVGVAVAVEFDGGICSAVRIALGAVAPTVLRAREAENILIGKTLSRELIAEAAAQASEESSPIDDIRASADYRRHCVGVLTKRLLTNALELKSQGNQ